ncbi:MAG: cyclic nucleotide-binding domain-containing protein [Chloroflexi bacterium]|nr:cyclic nucleotide-binding domain-containing protein [Chloroflexota bacterium]MCI0574625.1 cyclic nucleotide-binding domain-containing protein [Chloroflexota bacterium]MCI0644023.1 cyclic nucleotide-binding domain-containing protein [Chloroflexota bacterium]MCI0731697.1 cyclic nucleotide-binding domain-containing protein [Chloroflexota bacterium]
MSEAEEARQESFWSAVDAAVDSGVYRPARCDNVVAARLNGRAEPYYVLKQPECKTYLRLSEQDYTLWWQMDGQKTVKDLLFYSLMRYGSLPIGRFSTLVSNLRNGRFLDDRPTNLYRQAQAALIARAPASRGRRILNALVNTELSVTSLDPFFTRLYRFLKLLFSPVVQVLLLAVVFAGGLLFARLFFQGSYSLSGGAAGFGLGFISLFLANLLVIGIHELSHGLAVKHFGRELDRGGFLIYWGFPAFFVDTRDIWLSPRRARILVSWAGPHSGLILGGLAGFILTAVSLLSPDSANTLWASFIYQVGFIAFFSVFININPLLELDGYFILMDWLEMPGLRQRAFAFLRRDFWSKLRANPAPPRFWPSLNSTERVFTLFGLAAVVYSVYALAFALYFWQTRLWPFVGHLWQNYGLPGRLLVLLVTAAILVPTIYFVGAFVWSRVQAGLEWLARRDLLARPDVLALLISVPLTAGGILSLLLGGLAYDLATLLAHLSAALALVGVAWQIRGSRFQWALWAMAIVLLEMTLAFLAQSTSWNSSSLIISAGVLLAVAGAITWLFVWPVRPLRLTLADQLLMAFLVLVELGNAAALGFAAAGYPFNIPIPAALVLLLTAGGLALLAPMLLNFWYSRFAFPWLLLVLAVLALPWLVPFPILHGPVAGLWLFAGLLYLALGLLTQFPRHAVAPQPAASERERLVNGFSHFLQALFATYEGVFGGRRLAAIQEQLVALGFLDRESSILEIADYCRTAVLLAVDRLDDLAGTAFTARAGQAAYDSLPWLEAEALARHVLSQTEWAGQLAEDSIRRFDRWAELIRQADVFAGFDQEDIRAVLQVTRPWHSRAGATIAEDGREATRFFLVEYGQVGVYENGEQTGVLTSGGSFGTYALLDRGIYQATYRALTDVRAIVIDRHRFDPLLRADTTLASQVSGGAKERALLKRMPLFATLSPQQLAAVDARLRRLSVPAGRVIARRGQLRTDLFIVLRGQVEASQPGPAGQPIAERYGPGEHFGEYALFADSPYTATYQAVSDTELLLLDEVTFDDLVARCERMSHYVEQIGSGRLIETRRRLGLSGVVG